jgi:Tol biopolymer transport system component
MTQSTERLSSALAGRYKILSRLGEGGMATVYLAEDLKHDRKVAVKVLRPELAAVLGADRFVQEIKTTANLQHPHILPLFDSGEADSFLYYVMPYIEGETLRAKLDRESQFGIDEAVKITTEVADALDYAHRQGVIHRGIKPENILLQDGRPMVADFGIALAVSAAAGGRMTETGLSLGTPHYMSPEQATAEKDITARSDIYSLGSVLYETLAGEPPHLGGSAQQIIMKIVTEEAQPLTRRRKSVPSNVAAAVAKALEKLPADRFDSAKDFAEALRNSGFTTAGVAAAPGSMGVVRNRLPWLVAGAALVTALVLALLLVRPPPADGPRVPWLTNLATPDTATFEQGLAIAEDGSFILYGGGSPLGIWIRRADAENPARIPGTLGGCCPAISPDGQRVAFVRDEEVRIIPLTGGTSTLAGTGITQGDDITWMADGSIVGARVDGDGLLRVTAGGGPVEPFTTVDTAAGELMHWSPHALPEGRGVVFSIVPQSSVQGSDLKIGVVGPSGGAHTVLMPGRMAAYADPGYLLVTRANGAIVAVPFDPAARRTTGDPVPLITVPNEPGTFTWAGYFVVSRTGTLVYVSGTGAGNEMVWMNQTGTIATVDSNETARFIFTPTIAPDGNTLAFFEGNKRSIEIRNLQTGASSRIEDEAGSVSQHRFSADSRSIYFILRAPGRTGVYRAELGRLEEFTPVLLGPGLNLLAPSPDERTLYFRRGEGREVDLIARPLEGQDTTEHVLASGVWSPRLSPDGRWLAFVDEEQGTSQLYLRSTDPARTERWPVFRAAEWDDIRWAPNGRELYFNADGSMRAARLSIDDAPVTERVDSLFPMRGYYSRFAMAPDGRFLLTRRRSRDSRTRLMLVDDWRALLGRR